MVVVGVTGLVAAAAAAAGVEDWCLRVFALLLAVRRVDGLLFCWYGCCDEAAEPVPLPEAPSAETSAESRVSSWSDTSIAQRVSKAVEPLRRSVHRWRFMSSKTDDNSGSSL